MIRFVFRSLIHYWRTNLAVVAGVATTVTVLSGALMVGNSVRSSLASLLGMRLGAVENLISANRFFREDLAAAFDPAGMENIQGGSCPIIYLPGVVIHERTGLRVNNVNVYGVDQRFWRFQGIPNQIGPEGRTAFPGSPLARRLGIRPGDGLLLRVETQQGIPKETLYGRREEAGRTLRLTSGDILPEEKQGEFSLRPAQGDVYSIFIPLQRLQRDLGKPAGANLILLGANAQFRGPQQIRARLKEKFTLQDAGITLRPFPSQKGIIVESNRILLDDSVARAALTGAADLGMKSSGVFTYLANSIRAGGREIPYSVIAAADLRQGAMMSVTSPSAVAAHAAAQPDDSIWLNEWAGRELGIPTGAAVEVDYYVWLEEGRLLTRTARFILAGFVSIAGDVNASLAPDFPGITGSRNMKDWDPPFPLDLGRIRPRDEEYWSRYQATPKAFISLAKGQELWQTRFGRLSSVRAANPGRVDLSLAQTRLAEQIRRRLEPESVGFTVNDIRMRGLDASRGSTDFGEYFLYFSFFLIAAAVLFFALFFKLGVEQRVREIGALKAMGFPLSALRRNFLAEGAILSIGGSLLGLVGSIGYGGLLVFGLRTWWIGAIGTDRLSLHVSWVELCLGAGGGVLLSLVVIAWTLRGLRRISPRALLSGVLESGSHRLKHTRLLWVFSPVLLLAAFSLLAGSTLNMIPDVEGFFGAGLLLLMSLLGFVSLYLRLSSPHPIFGHGWPALLRFGIRNARHRPGRSLICVALIASATFIIVSVEAFRQDPQSLSLDPNSGTGGYPLLAESALPVVHNPNSPEGREALGIPESEVPEFAQVRFVPFRVRPGDDASCLNLYAPQEPRILGATAAFISAGRFSFRSSLAVTPAEKQNPWRLLESARRDDAIPAIGDANTIQYALHLSLGRELTIRRSDGVPVRLRLVASLRDSVLQGELIISETNFLRLFPDQEGYRFFFVEAPAARAEALVRPISERLADWGFSLENSREKLASYRRVENTYLSTFQSLGALGLILGTAGLATILLRNVLERRRELALLRAAGYRREIISRIIFVENVFMLIGGLGCGTLASLLSVLPALRARGTPFPAAMLFLLLSGVFAAGVISSILATVAALRAPLLGALKSESAS